MTGRPPLPSVGAQTFRDKQSSLPPGSRNTMSGKIRPCMHRAPNLVAWRTPAHLDGSAGGFHRSFPTGGAAYGIPRKTFTDPAFFPSTMPLSVFTRGAAAYAANELTNVTTTTSHLPKVRIHALLTSERNARRYHTNRGARPRM